MDIYVLANNDVKVLQKRLHYIFKYTNLIEHKLFVVVPKAELSSTYFDTHNLLRYLVGKKMVCDIVTDNTHVREHLSLLEDEFPLGWNWQNNKNGVSKIANRHVYTEQLLVIVPTFGEIVKSTEDVLKSFDEQDNKEFGVMLMCCDDVSFRYYGDLIYERFDSNFKCFPALCKLDAWSRSQAFNNAVIRYYSDKYIFHDRDILVPRDFIKKIKDMYNLQYMINYDSIYRNNYVETNAVGGSNTVSWEYFMRSGGMCSEMVGWGGEDVEFNHRVSFGIENKRHAFRIACGLTHIDHPIEIEDKQSKVNIEKMYKHIKHLNRVDLWKLNYIYEDYKKYWNKACPIQAR